MVAFSTLREHKPELRRKGLDGSVFVADYTADLITTLTSGASPTLTALPTGYEDLGVTSDDGSQFEREIEEQTDGSFGHAEPTRADIVSDITTLTVTAQETKLLTLALYTGADTAGIEADATTGETHILKPNVPSTRYYRILALYVDQHEGLDLYIGRILPRAKVTNRGAQQFGKTEAGIVYELGITAFFDSTAGYSEDYFLAGPGAKALNTSMGITTATP
jgi:hypothetical protein